MAGHPWKGGDSHGTSKRVSCTRCRGVWKGTHLSCQNVSDGGGAGIPAKLLLSIAQQPENRLTLAYTASGTIVGRVSLTPLDQWWQAIGNAYEIAVEISSRWRQLGIAHHLLSLALAFEAVEEYLIVGLGLCWHWDEEGLGMSRFHYRAMLARLFAAHGFAEYLTSEPNILMDPANILLARLGSRIDSESMNRFFQQLLQSETLPGL